MSKQDMGASVPDQALVSDQAELHRLDPTGFDPSRWASVLTRQERRYLIATPIQEPAGAGFIAARAADFRGHGAAFSGFARRRSSLFQIFWQHPCRNIRLYRLTPAGVAVRDAAIAMEAATAAETCNRLDPTGDSAGRQASPKGGRP